MVIDAARRRWRRRRASRLLARARSRPSAELSGTVPALCRIVAVDDADARFRAVEALATLARGSTDGPVRDRATDALVDLLTDGAPPIQAAVSPELRYVALERPDVISRLDDPYAAILTSPDHRARRRVATDVGILLAEHDDADLPASRAALEQLLVGGDPEGRRAAATAYVLLADAPSAVENPGTVAEHLAILSGELDGPLVAPESHLRGLADDRTLEDAVSAFAAGDP